MAGLMLLPAPVLAQIAAESTAPVNLDLSSTERNQIAGSQGSILVEGVQKAINPTDLLTAAEFAALSQVINGGQQTLQISGAGNAIGGTVNLSALAQGPLAGLLVPQGVTAVHDFAQLSALNVLGNLTNSGTLYAVSSNSAVTSAVFNANNIYNNQGGVLTSILPSGGLLGLNSLLGNLNLNLNAIGDIINAGTIASAGSLTATAGGSIINALPAGLNGVSPIMQAVQNLNLQAANIVNQGVLASQLGNIAATTSALNNSSVMQALSGSVAIQNLLGNTLSVSNLLGSIEARDKVLFQTLATTFDGNNNLLSKAGLDLSGGTVKSAQIDFVSPEGKVRVNAGALDGRVNVSAGEAAVGVTSSSSLELGDMIITGDPTFYNTGGDVVINGALSFSGQPLAILAAGDILSGPLAGAISTSNAAGSGGVITMVAGASLTSTGSSSVLPPGVGDTSSTITISGGSVLGGKIDLVTNGAITSLTSQSTGGGGSGGAISLLAFHGAHTNGGVGTITLPTAVTINSGGNGAGANGAVTIVAGATSGTTVSIGAISASGGATGAAVTLNTATPSVGGGVTILNGAITSGSFAAGSPQAASISTGSITAPGGNIAIVSGANFVGGALSATSTTGSGGAISISTSSSTSFNIGGGGANGTSGAITAAAAAAGGTGGNISVFNTGSGGITHGTTGNLSVTAGAGSVGGSITLDAVSNGGTGSLSFPGTVSLTANGVGGSGSGGNITLKSTNAISSTGVLTLTADGGLTGSGGQVNVSVTSTTGDITANTSGANNLNISTRGGSSSGQGGTITLTAGRNLTVSSVSALNLSPFTGAGGTYNLTAGATAATGNLAITGALSASAVNSGSGGTINLNSKSATSFNIGGGGANGTSAGLTASAVSSGAGGTISITNNGSGGITHGTTANIGVTAVGGAGGTIVLDAVGVGGTGSLSFPGTVTVSALGNGGGAGGTITLKSTAAFTSTGLLTLSANAGTSGIGGVVNLTTTGTTANITVNSSGANNATISARGGSSSGAGGTINLSAGQNLTVSAVAALNAQPFSGAGGNYNLTAGATGTSGNVAITGALSASAVGSGAGGTITISSKSATTFNIGGGGANGTSGALSAAAVSSGAGGTISITNNLSGGITHSTTGNISVAAAGTGMGGTVVLDAVGVGGTGSLSFPGTVSITASGVGAAAGGTITLKSTASITTSALLTLTASAGSTGTGGTINVTTTGATGDIILNDAAGTNRFMAVARGGTTSGTGGIINLNAGDDLTITNPVNSLNNRPFSGAGGSYILAAGSVSGAGDVSISAGFNASAVTSGAGGTISITSVSATSFNIGGGGANGTGGALAANAAGTGGGGTIIIRNAGTNGITHGTSGNLSVTAVGAGSTGGTIELSAAYNGASGTLALGTGIDFALNGVGAGGGGTLILQGATITTSDRTDIFANGGTTGIGGTVSITTTGGTADIQINDAGGTNRFDISALGGSTSGNGGSVILSAGRDILVTDASNSITINPQTSGKGAIYTLTAGRNLDYGDLVDADARGTGDGGTVVITTNSATTFVVDGGSANGTDNNIQANAAGTGKGGFISITNLGSGGITNTATNNIQVAATTNGDGGTIILNAGTGAMNLGAINLTASAAGNGQGGVISLTAGALTNTGAAIYSANGAGSGSAQNNAITINTSSITLGGLLQLNASGGTTGNGGGITVTTSGATADITVNNTGNAIQITNRGGSTSGNGGSTTVSAGDDLTINMAGLLSTPQAGSANGASYSLTSGSASTTGFLDITDSLSADGLGAGNAGNITLAYTDTAGGATFQIGGTGTNSSISGNVTANAPGAGNGGSISISNSNSGTGLNLTLIGNLTTSSGSGSSGTITFNEGGQAISVSGAGALSGRVSASGSAVTLNTSAAANALTVNTISASGGAINLTASGSGSSINLLHGGSISATGGAVALTSSAIVVNGTVAANTAASSITVGASAGLTLGGSGSFTTGAGGTITVSTTGANVLSLNGSFIYNTGSGGVVNLQSSASGASIAVGAGTKQIITSNSTLNISTATLGLARDTQIRGYGMTGNPVNFVSGSNPLLITLDDSYNSTISTAGGQFNFAMAAGQSLTFAKTAGSGSSILYLLGGNTVIAATAAVAVNQSVTVRSDANVSLTTTGGAGSTQSVNGFIETTSVSGLISMQSTGAITIGAFGGLAGDQLNLQTTANNSNITINSNIIGVTSSVLSANGSGDITFTNTKQTDIPAGNYPKGVTVNPANTFVFVANQNLNNQPNDDSISIISTANNTELSTRVQLPAGSQPLGMDITPDGNRLYVAYNGPGQTTVAVYDLTTFNSTSNPADISLVTNVTVGTQPHTIAITADGQYAYVTNQESDNVSVIRTSDNVVTATIAVGDFPKGIAFTGCDNGLIYVSNTGTGDLGNTVSAIDVATNTVFATITVGTGPRGIAFNPTGRYAYVANQVSDTVSVIDTTSHTVIDTIAVGDGPNAVSVNKAGTLVYVANQGTSDISVINTAAPDFNVVATVPAGTNPFPTGDFVAFVGVNNLAYLPNQNSDNVSVIRFPTVVTSTATLSSGTGDIVVGTSATNVTANTSGAGNVYLTASSAVNLGASTAGNIFQLGAFNTIVTSGALSATSIVLQNTVSGGSMTLGGNVTASSGVVTVMLSNNGTLTNNFTISSSASGPLNSISIFGQCNFSLAGSGGYAPGVGNTVYVGALESISFANGINQVASNGNIFIQTPLFIGANGGTANISANAGTVTVSASLPQTLTFRPVTPGQTTSFTLSGTTTTANAQGVDVFANTTVQATTPLNFNLSGTTFTNNGIVRSSATGDSINITAAGNLTLAGSGTYDQSSGGNTRFICACGSNEIRLSAGLNQTITGGGGIELLTPSLVLESSAGLNATGSSIIDVTPNCPNALTVTVVAGSNGTVSTTGGAINIFPTSGFALTFARSGVAGDGTLVLSGGDVTTTSSSTTTVNSNVVVSADSTNLTMNVNGSTLTNNGTIRSTNVDGLITLQSTSGLVVAGTGTVSLTGNGLPSIIVQSAGANALSFTGSQTYSAPNAGSNSSVLLFAQDNGGSVTFSGGTTQTVTDGMWLYFSGPTVSFGANANITASGASPIFFYDFYSGCANCGMQITAPTGGQATVTTAGGYFDFTAFGTNAGITFNRTGGAGTAILNLNGGVVSVNTNGTAVQTVAAGLTVASNNNISFNPYGGGTFTLNGAVTSSRVAGVIMVDGFLNTVTLNGSGGQMSVTGGGAALIRVQGAGMNLNTTYSMNAGSSGNVMFVANSSPITLGNGVSLTAAGGSQLTLDGTTITLGTGTTIVGTRTTGEAIQFNNATGALTVNLPSSSTVTVTSSGGDMAFYGKNGMSITRGSGTSSFNVTGGRLTTQTDTGTQTIGTGVTLSTNQDIFMDINNVAGLTLNGTITTSKSAGSILIQGGGNAGGGFVMAGTPGGINVTGGGAASITVTGFTGLTMNSSYTFNAGSSGTITVGVPQTGFNMALAAGVNLTASGQSSLTIRAETLNLGGSSVISTNRTTGTGLLFASPLVSSNINVNAVGGATVTFQTSGATLDVATVGGGRNINFARSSGTGTAAFQFNGAPVTMSLTNGTVTVGANTSVTSNNSLTFNTTTSNFTNNGTISANATSGFALSFLNIGTFSNTGSITATGGSGIRVTNVNNIALSGAGTMSAGTQVSLVSSNGAVTASQTSIAGTVLGSSKNTFDVTTTSASAALTVGSITTTTGDINVTSGTLAQPTGTAVLTVAAGATLDANQGSIKIQNFNTSAGTIVIGAGAIIDAFTNTTNMALGNVTIVIGAVPGSPVNGTTPSNVTLNIVAGGNIYFGTTPSSSIQANAPNSVLNAFNRTILFNTGARPASAITLMGGNTIVADPPEPGAVIMYGDPIPTPVVEAIQPPVEVVVNQPSTVISTDTQSVVMQLRDGSVSTDIALNDLISSMVPSEQQPADESDAAQESTNEPAVDEISEDNSLKPIAFVQPALPAPVTRLQSHLRTMKVGDGTVRHSGGARFSVDQDGVLEHKAGEMLISAQRPMVITSGGHKVRLQRGSVALINRENGVLKVRNVYEKAAHSIQVDTGLEYVKVAAGGEVMVSGDKATLVSGVQKDKIGRRNVQQLKTASGHHVMKSEVSILSLSSKNATMRQLMRSSDKQDRILSNNLMKMAACLMLVTSSHGAYASGEKTSISSAK